jgi:hypothetical protein
MFAGKYLSLSEARRKYLLDRFMKEHPSSGDEDEFDRLLDIGKYLDTLDICRLG